MHTGSDCSQNQDHTQTTLNPNIMNHSPGHTVAHRLWELMSMASLAAYYLRQAKVPSHLFSILLTGYLQRCVPADSLTQVVPGYTDIHSLIWFAPPSMHDTQKEKGAAGQQHAMGSRVFLVRLHPLPILVPLNDGGGTSFRFAVQRCWLPLGHNEVGGMLYYPRR